MWANCTTLPQLAKMADKLLLYEYIAIVSVEAATFLGVCIWRIIKAKQSKKEVHLVPNTQIEHTTDKVLNVC